MNMLTKVLDAAFTAIGAKHEVHEEDSVITLGWNMEGSSMDILVICDDDGNSIGLRGINYCSFDASKKDQLYKVCSQLNDHYRWVKFYVDEDHNQIMVADDAVVQLDSAGEEAIELVIRMVGIAQQAYPVLMRAIWA